MFKKERTAKAIVLMGVILMAGCASRYPIPVSEPPAYTAKSAQEVDPLMERTRADYSRGGLLAPKDMPQAIENMKIYGDAYQDYSDTLRKGEYITDDLGVLGAITSVVGGLTSSVETVVAGAVLGAGAPMFSERYNLLVQSNNYEKASTAMYCMRSKLRPTTGEGIDYLDAREWIDEIRRKLRKAQSSVELVKIDPSDFKKVVLASVANEKEVETTEKAVVDAKKDEVAVMENQEPAIQPADNQTKDASRATAINNTKAINKATAITKAKIATLKAVEENKAAKTKALTSSIEECIIAFGSS